MADPYVLPPDAKAGTIYLSKNLDPTKDITIAFEYACYGPEVSGSEGFSVFFFDTYAGSLRGGGPGPGLGYAPAYGISATVEGQTLTGFGGVEYGQLGIGFDLTGNYGTSAFGLSGLSERIPNTVTVRDSQDKFYNRLYTSAGLNTTAFKTPFSLYQQVTSYNDVVFKTVRIRLTDFCKTLLIDWKERDAEVFTNYVTTSLPDTWTAASVNACLSFTSGLTGTCFAVKNLNVNGIFTSLTAVPDIFDWFYYGAWYLGMSPNPAILTVNDTIIINNAFPYDNTEDLILINPEGAAPLQNEDGYILINYGASSFETPMSQYIDRVTEFVNISPADRNLLIQFYEQMETAGLWRQMIDGWILSSRFNDSTSTNNVLSLKNPQNTAQFVAGGNGIIPTWSTSGVRFYTDSDPSNIGPRIIVPNWSNADLTGPMAIACVYAPLTARPGAGGGSCIFGKTTFAGGSGSHFGINYQGLQPGKQDFYVGINVIKGGYFSTNIPLSTWQFSGLTTDGTRCLAYINEYYTVDADWGILNNTFVPGTFIDRVCFGADSRDPGIALPNREFDGYIAAGFVFNEDVDFNLLQTIYNNTIGSNFYFRPYPY
jgi:hypothetical protein